MLGDWVIEGWGRHCGFSIRYCLGLWTVFLFGGTVRRRFTSLFDAVTFASPITRRYRRFRNTNKEKPNVKT